jgi:hypothetical protein
MVDDGLLEALEDFVKRQRKRLAIVESTNEATRQPASEFIGGQPHTPEKVRG